MTLQDEEQPQRRVVTSSVKPKLGFHLEIHQKLQEIQQQRLKGKTTQKIPPLLTLT